MTTPTCTALWVACPAEDGEHWLPWELYQITPPPCPLDESTAPGSSRWWRARAHEWARDDRQAWPGHLVAVRAYEPGINAGCPVSPVGMLDHYDMAPYSDEYFISTPPAI
jgi:hypothetical protein